MREPHQMPATVGAMAAPKQSQVWGRAFYLRLSSFLVSDAVEASLIEAIPQADVMLYLDPVSLANDQLDERIEAL